MDLMKFDPFRSSTPTVGNFFDDFFNRSLGDFVGSDFANSIPSVNVIDGEKEVTLELAAPGLEKNDFHIDIDDDQLMISVEKEHETEEEGEKFMRREFSYRNFQRSFYLPDSIDSDKINAKYENGILKIHMPKRKEAMAVKKQIEIS